MDLEPRLARAMRTVLSRHPEVRLGLVFGSRARDVAASDADLDLAVEIVPGQSFDRLGLMAALSAETGLEVDVVDVSPGCRVGYPLLAALVRDGVAVYEGRAHAEAEFRTRALLQTSLDRPWYERMRDAYLERLAAGADG